MTARLLSEAVDVSHRTSIRLVKRLMSEEKHAEAAEVLRAGAQTALAWGTVPPMRQAALAEVYADEEKPNYITAVSGSTIKIHISDSKRTSAPTEAERAQKRRKLGPFEVLVSTRCLGGKLLQLWLHLGRPLMQKSLGLEDKAAELPFLLDHKGAPLGGTTQYNILMKQLVDQAQWDQVQQDVALALLPGHQAAMRRLYASIRSLDEAESVAKAMDTSACMVREKYNVFQIHTVEQPASSKKFKKMLKAFKQRVCST